MVLKQPLTDKTKFWSLISLNDQQYTSAILDKTSDNEVNKWLYYDVRVGEIIRQVQHVEFFVGGLLRQSVVILLFEYQVAGGARQGSLTSTCDKEASVWSFTRHIATSCCRNTNYWYKWCTISYSVGKRFYIRLIFN